MNKPFDLPEMLDPADVCSAMDDLVFMEYCYSNFDVNHDHKVGLHEAHAVREMDLSDTKVVSLRGIEYFTNLERLILNGSTVTELNLLANTRLQEVSAQDCEDLYFTALPNRLSVIPPNEIWYTTNDKKGRGVIVKASDRIEPFAFIGESTLTSIMIPNCVKSIGYQSFMGCINLKKMVLPASIISIGQQAFKGCGTGELIINCDIPDGYRNDFDDCGVFSETNFTKIIINNGVSKIGKHAFANCAHLTSIYIPDSITSIGAGAFYGCHNLSSVYITDLYAWINIDFEWDVFLDRSANPLLYASNLYLNGELISEINMQYGFTSIRDFAFCGLSQLTNIAIPKSVKTIGRGTFYGCSALIELILPEGLTSVGVEAFYGCSSLKSITIPDSVTSIGEGAFENCTSLENITIGMGATLIGNRAFIGCSSLMKFGGKYASEDGRCLIFDGVLISFAPAGLTEYTIPDGITSIGDYAFENCTSLESINIPDGVTSIRKCAFWNCTSLKRVNISNSVISIRERAFWNCTSLESINIPKNTHVGEMAFDNCSGMVFVNCNTRDESQDTFNMLSGSNFSKITICNDVYKIGNYAFAYLHSLTSAIVDDSVFEIGYKAFYDCSSLTTITIGKNVSRIGFEAFKYCKRLVKVYCRAIKPPQIGGEVFSIGGWGILDNNVKNRKIYVPVESVDAYKRAPGWYTYANQIVGYDFE